MEIPKDVYEYMINFADDRTILNMLSVNKKYSNPLFFEKIMKRKYPLLIRFKPENTPWKEYYLQQIYYIDQIGLYIPHPEYNPEELYRNLVNAPHILLNMAAEIGLEYIIKLTKKYEKYKFNINDYNSALVYASEKGHLDIVKYLISLGGNNYFWVFLESVDKGYLDIVQYIVEEKIHELKKKYQWDRLVDTALQGINLNPEIRNYLLLHKND